MPTSYFDQFYLIDPANPPLSGSILTVQAYELIDQNDNDFIESPGTDSIDGQDVTAVWPGDRLLLRIDGRVTVIRGTTFYLADGRAVFTPTDGKVLADAEFLDARFVTSESPMPVGSLGPPCLVAGTLVETARGRVPVEALRPGDRVRTRDHGLRPLLWRGATEVAGDGVAAPILFTAGSFGATEDLLVSPQHRMLVTGWRAQLFAGAEEVLVAARHLVDGRGIRRVPRAVVTYHHLLFDGHEIIRTGGVWSESFHPASAAERYEFDLRAALADHHPDLLARLARMPLARPQVRGYEGAILAA